VRSATVATTQDVRVSMVAAGRDEYGKRAPTGIGVRTKARPTRGRHYKSSTRMVKCAPRGDRSLSWQRALR
jgi:hypothetical protein